MGRCSQFSLQIVRTVVISLPVVIFGDQPIGPDFRSSVWEQTRSNQPCRSRQLVRSATRISSRFLSSGCRGGSSRHCWTVGLALHSGASSAPDQGSPPNRRLPTIPSRSRSLTSWSGIPWLNMQIWASTCTRAFSRCKRCGLLWGSTCTGGFSGCKLARHARLGFRDANMHLGRALHLGNPTLHVERHSPFSLAFGAMPFMKSRSKLFRSRLQIRSRTFNSLSNCFPFAGNISSDVFVRIYCIKRSPAIWCASPPIGASVQNDEDHKCSNFDLWPIPTLRSHKKSVCDRWLCCEFSSGEDLVV